MQERWRAWRPILTDVAALLSRKILLPLFLIIAGALFIAMHIKGGPANQVQTPDLPPLTPAQCAEAAKLRPRVDFPECRR